MKLTLTPWRICVLLLIVERSAAKQAPPALEASYKERIEDLLNSSANLAVGHLSKRFSLTDGLFSGYELQNNKKAGSKAAKWTHSCLEIDTSRDSVENCILRQLQALTALCDIPLTTQSKEIAERHLRHLLRSQEIPELAMKLQKMSGASMFLFRKEPDSGNMDASPAIQASMLMTMVRCGQALGQKQHLDDAEPWHFRSSLCCSHVAFGKRNNSTYSVDLVQTPELRSRGFWAFATFIRKVCGKKPSLRFIAQQ